MKIINLFLVSVICLSSWGFAQKDIDTKKLQPGDWKVKVILKGGAEVIGVVQQNKFKEKPALGVYHRVNSTRTPGAGIRLWYVRNSPGYTFIPFTRVARIVKLRPADITKEKERFREKRDTLREKRQTAIEEKKKQLETLKLKQEEESKEKEVDKEKKEAPKIKLSAEEKELLKEFPPGEEWNSARRDEINKQLKRGQTKFVRRVINGNVVLQKGAPNGGASSAEKKFYDNYDTWVAAIEKRDLIKELAEKEAAKKIKEEEEEAAQELVEKSQAKREAKKEAREVAKKEEEATKTTEIVKKSEQPLDMDKVTATLLYASEEEKKQVLNQLAQMGTKAQDATGTVHFLLKSKRNSPELKQAALDTIIKIGEPADKVTKILGETLASESVDLRRKSAAALAQYGTQVREVSQEMLTVLAFERDPSVKYEVIRTIEKVQYKEAILQIQGRLGDEDLSVRVAASSALLSFHGNEKGLPNACVKILTQALDHPAPKVRLLAANTLDKWDSEKAISAAEEKLSTVEDPKVKSVVESYIARQKQKAKEEAAVKALEKEKTEEEKRDRKAEESFEFFKLGKDY